MWYPSTVTAGPASEPVTLAQAKAQCGITDSSHDDQMNTLIAAGRSFVEKFCGIALVTQTVAAKCDYFADFSRLPVAPVQSVTSISYVDLDGADQTLPTSVYDVRSEGLAPSIVTKHGQTWPSVQLGSRITLTAVVGYTAVPKDIVLAILLMIGRQFSISGGDLRTQREIVEGIGQTFWSDGVGISSVMQSAMESLLENYRTWPL